MTLTEIAEVISMVRDVLIIIVLIVSAIFLLNIFIKIRSLLNLLSKTSKNLEQIIETVSNLLVERNSMASGFTLGIWKFISLIGGLKSSKNKGDDTNGK